ncbi:LWXIA domain-containing protein [Burkholderia anthina]|uniref:LWXIA domain-containing protein n=1 Tax=Burkholderia anthina TaxID=179879 RepID=UPI00158D45D0
MLSSTHVLADEQQRLSDDRRINIALGQIRSFNRNLASRPRKIHPGAANHSRVRRNPGGGD